jgi:hypothetical protein
MGSSSIGAPFGEPGGGSSTGVFEREGLPCRGPLGVGRKDAGKGISPRGLRYVFHLGNLE